MRVLGLDFGSKTIGVAISDPLGFTAQGLGVIRRPNDIDVEDSLRKLLEIIEKYNVEKIVLGYPKHMNNSIGERAKKTEKFKEKIEKATNLEVILWDERMSTMAAESHLVRANVRRKKRSQVIDKMAAVFILQGYLDSK